MKTLATLAALALAGILAGCNGWTVGPWYANYEGPKVRVNSQLIEATSSTLWLRSEVTNKQGHVPDVRASVTRTAPNQSVVDVVVGLR